jgi:WD40 repeat protein
MKYDVRAPGRAIAFAADTNEVFTAVDDGTVYKRPIKHVLPLQMLSSPSPYFPAGLAVSDDGRWAAAWGTNHSLRLWEVSTQRVWQWPEDNYVGAAFTNGDALIVACLRGAIRIWDLKSENWCGDYSASPQENVAMALSPDGTLLAVATKRPAISIKLFDTATRSLTGEIQGHLLPPQSLAWSPDSKTLASASAEGQVRLWHAATRQQLGTLKCRTAGDIPYLVFSPDGQALAAAVHGNPKSQWNISGVCMWHLATAEVSWNGY